MIKLAKNDLLFYRCPSPILAFILTEMISVVVMAFTTFLSSTFTTAGFAAAAATFRFFRRTAAARAASTAASATATAFSFSFFAYAWAITFGCGTFLQFLRIIDDVDRFAFIGAFFVFQSRA